MTPAPMNKLLADLVKLMTLERLELNLFRGESRDIGSAQVFGGQVLGHTSKQSDDLNQIRLSGTVRADEDVQVAKFDPWGIVTERK